MKIAIISDVHIDHDNDEPHQLIKAFFSHDFVKKEITDIFLLGDIFDFFCGDYEEYQDLYSSFFRDLKEIMAKGKKIHYFEGNHDFHVASLLKRIFSDEYKRKEFFTYKKGVTIDLDGKKIYFSHGDFLYIGDFFYKIYLLLIKNGFLHAILNRLLTFKQVMAIGRKETEKSRYNRTKAKTDFKKLKKMYQKGIRFFAYLKNAEIYILGHSHVKDNYSWFHRGVQKRYFNNGFFPHSKSFLVVDSKENYFVNLADNEYSK